jgi:replicative DNA helicase
MSTTTTTAAATAVPVCEQLLVRTRGRITSLEDIYKRITNSHPVHNRAAIELATDADNRTADGLIDDPRKAQLPIAIFGVIYGDTDRCDTSQNAPRRLSGLVCIDFDDVDEQAPPADVLAAVSQCPYVLMAFRSPSRTGIKVVVRTEGFPTATELTTTHRREYYATYQAAAKQIAADIGYEIKGDSGAKAPEQTCFLPFDDAAVFIPAAFPFPWVTDLPPEQTRPTGPSQPFVGGSDVDQEVIRRLVAGSNRKFDWSPDAHQLDMATYQLAISMACNGVPPDVAQAQLESMVPEGCRHKMARKVRMAMRYASMSSSTGDLRAKVVEQLENRQRRQAEDYFSATTEPPPTNDPPPTDAPNEPPPADPPKDPPPPKGLRRWTVEQLDADARSYPRPTMVGIPALDEDVGVRPGGLVLVGAEPGAGKTLFLLNVMLSMARHNSTRTFIYYSAEITAREARARLVLAMAPPRKTKFAPSYLAEDGALYTRDRAAGALRYDSGVFIRNEGELLSELHRRAGERGVSFDDICGTNRLFERLAEGQRAVDELLRTGRVVIADDEDQLIQLADLQTDLSSTTPLPLGAVFLDYCTQVVADSSTTADLRERAVNISRSLTALTRKGKYSLWSASQISREAATSRKKKDPYAGIKATVPTHHIDAIGGAEPASHDVFVESAQWNRDTDVALLLHNPAQGAQRNDKLAEQYPGGTIPLLVRVWKQRGGESGKVITLGLNLADQRICSDVPLPKVCMAKGRFYTQKEQNEEIAKHKKSNDDKREKKATGAAGGGSR